MEKIIFGKSVDISKKIDHQEYNGYTFVENGWLNLKEKYNMETDSDELMNVGIRSVQHQDRDVESFAHRLQKKTWDISKPFPPYDKTANAPIGGRKRIKSLIFKGQEWMPIAIYTPTKNCIRTQMTGGLIENTLHDGGDDAEFADFLTTAAYLISKGQLVRTEKEVESWLINDCKLGGYFPKQTIDKLIDQICSLDEEGLILMKCVDRKDATDYCKKYLKKLKKGDDNFGLDFEKDCLLMSPSEVNSYRILGHMIENAKEKKKTNVILYSTSFNPNKATNRITANVKELKYTLVGGLCHLINHDLPENWPEQLRFEEPFESKLLNIIGCIPQKVGNKTHESKYASHDIINVEDY